MSTEDRALDIINRVTRLHFEHPNMGPRVITSLKEAGLVIEEDWRPEEMAEDHVAMLVQHEDDLYPVTAYCMDGTEWFYESDGPEDIIEDGDHKHQPLKRPPTHCKPLPAPPEAT